MNTQEHHTYNAHDLYSLGTAGTKWFGKCLMVLGSMCNRLLFEPNDMKAATQAKLWAEIGKQSAQAFQGASRTITWMKHHLGPVALTEAPVSGFAYWNFEDNRYEYYSDVMSIFCTSS